jgi:hypothetical protein
MKQILITAVLSLSGISNAQSVKKMSLPFIGTKKFCIATNENQSKGTLMVTITKSGIMSYSFILSDNGECSDGCEIKHKYNLKGYKATGAEGKIVFYNKNKFKWIGEEGDFIALECN